MEENISRPMLRQNGTILKFASSLFEAAEYKLRWLLSWILSGVIQWVFQLDEVVEVLTVERYGIMLAEGIYIKFKGFPPITIEKIEVKVEWGMQRLGCVLSTTIVTNARFVWTDFLNSSSEVESVLSFSLEYPLFLTLKEKLISFQAFSRKKENLQPLNCISLALHWLTARDVKASHRTVCSNGFVSSICGLADEIDVIFLVKEDKLLQIVSSCSGLEFSCHEDVSGFNDSLTKIVVLPENELQVDYGKDISPIKFNLFVNRSSLKLIPFILKTVIASVEPLYVLLSPTQRGDLAKRKLVVSTNVSENQAKMKFQVKVNNHTTLIGVEENDCSIIGKFSLTGNISQWINKMDVGAVLMLQLDIKESITQTWHTVIGSVVNSGSDKQQILIAFSGCHSQEDHVMTCSVQVDDSLHIFLNSSIMADCSYICQNWKNYLESSDVDVIGMAVKVDDEIGSLLSLRKFCIQIPDLILVLNDRADEEVIACSATGTCVNVCVSKDEEFFESRIEDFTVENRKDGVTLFFQSKDEHKSLPILQMVWKKCKYSEDSRIIFKLVDIEPGNVNVDVKELQLIRILKFAHDVKDSVFWSFRETDSSMTTSFIPKALQFIKLEVHPFQAIVGMEPTSELPDELRLLKMSLSLPPQFPPKIEETLLQFGSFIRNNIQYKSIKTFAADVKKYYFKELGVQSTKVVGAFHLLGNLSQLKRQVKTSLTQLKETGDVKSFVSEVSQGVTDSYSKIRGSWSEYLTAASAQTPSSSTANIDESDGQLIPFSPLSPSRVVSRVRNLIGSFTAPFIVQSSPISTCITSSPTIDIHSTNNQVVKSGTASAQVSQNTTNGSPVNRSTSQVPLDREVSVRNEKYLETTRPVSFSQKEITNLTASSLVFRDVDMDDTDEDYDSEGYVTPEEDMTFPLNTNQPIVAFWQPSRNEIRKTPERVKPNPTKKYLQLPRNKKLLPGSYIKHAKGQEFLRRLKTDLGEEEPNEKFVTCITLRSIQQGDKLRAFVTNKCVYFMKNDLPSVKSVVLSVNFPDLLNAQLLQSGSSHYVKLVMRAYGTRRLSLASRNPADSPLVRCDSMTIARKAVSKINEARKGCS